MHTEANPPEAIDNLINRENPWPGLSSFTEETAVYFHGRDQEAEELFRLIKRETLTVLFGLSGLGKTSLLRAGIFPFLRREGFLPVYVRLNYADDAPDLVVQVKDTLRDVSAKAEISVPSGQANETLWEYFHRAGNVFKTPEGRTITPVLIFDQFEEMFTLGAGNDNCQARITAFLEQLSDLIENRPPETAEEATDTDAEEAFDFYKKDYKVVVSLREDFLANLESLANQLPSIGYNRFRLQKMNGEQALEVVLKSGGELVNEDVAERIVKMVAGRAPHAKVALKSLEIEPTLLSVFCREINNSRIAGKHATITPQLLSGSKEAILIAFYERALRGFDSRVRYFVEDRLLTGSGYRNSVALEDALRLPGITREAIFTLIDRRLLRIEESGRLQRVELTHDVLTEVIKNSRDDRQVREAAEQAELQARRAAEELREKDQQLRNARRLTRFLLVLYALALILLAYAIWAGYGEFKAKKEAESERDALQKANAMIQQSNDAADVFFEKSLLQIQQALNGLGHVSVLDQTANQAIALLQQQEKDEASVGEKLSDAQLHFQESIHSTLGDVFRAENDLGKAFAQYDASIQSAQALADRHPDDSQHIHYLEELAERKSGLNNTLDGGSKADALVFKGSYDDANKLYVESGTLTEEVAKLATDPKDKTWVERQRANVAVREADILRQTGKYAEALSLYEQNLAARKKLAEADPANAAYQLDLANAFFRRGLFETAEGRFDLALTDGLEARRIRLQFAPQHAGDINWQRMLFYSYLTLGRLMTMEGKLGGDEGAQQLLTNGLQKESQMATENPANKDLQRESGIGLVFLGNYYRANGDWDQAGANFTQALTLQQNNQDASNHLWSNFVGVAYLDLGDVQAHQQKFDEAAKTYQQALKVFRDLTATNQKNSDWMHNQALTNERLGYIASLQKDYANARKYYQAAIDTYKQTLKLNSSDPINQNGYAWLLATCPVTDLRDGKTALAEATTACGMTNGTAWEFLDTRAAADVAANDFRGAVADEQAALDAMAKIDPTLSDTHVIAGLKSRLKCYQQGQACPLSPLESSDR